MTYHEFMLVWGVGTIFTALVLGILRGVVNRRGGAWVKPRYAIALTAMSVLWFIFWPLYFFYLLGWRYDRG